MTPADDRSHELWDGDPGFDTAVAALPATAHRGGVRPAAVVIPRTTDEVRTVLLRAADRGLQVTVRSGGHGLSGTHMAEGAVAVDLREFRAARLDGGLLRIGAGTTSLRLAAMLDEHRVRFPLGHSPAVGVGGFLLAGGNGWAGTDLGAAAHRVVSAEVSCGDGRSLSVDRADAELFAVLRGAGCAFPAVVTEFTVDAEPGPVQVDRTAVDLPIGLRGEVGAFLDDLGQTAGLEITVFVRPQARTISLVITRFDGARCAGLDAVLERWRTHPQWELAVDSWSGLLRSIPDFATDGQLSDHLWVDEGWQRTLSAVPDEHLPGHPRSSVLLASAPRLVAGAGDALYQPTGIGVSVYAHHDGNPDPERHWMHAVLGPLTGRSNSRYIGEADLTAAPQRWTECLPPGAVPRISALRDRLDPLHVVRTVADLATA